MTTETPSVVRVLLISDDSKDVLRLRMFIAEIKAVRYEFIVAATLDEACAKIESDAPRLALLDLSLKGNNGLDLFRSFQKCCTTLPVVILTARDDQDLAFEAVRIGAQDYLAKSKLDPNVLFRVMYNAVERHRIMAEMRRKNEELQRLNSLKSEFVSTVSHELRTPLTVVLSAANNLLDGAFGDLADAQRKWVKKISHHSMRLHEMISDILDLSKLQSGKSQMRRESIEMGKLVRAAVTTLQMMAKEKQVTLSHKVPSDLPAVWGDPSRLDQVVANLITNALKYTPAGGRVNVSVAAESDRLVVSIDDNGPGIAPEHQDLIFDRFRQIRSQEKNESSTQGIGLGLAICKEIVDQHHGRIWVESEVGKGSKFSFDVPLDARAQTPMLKVLVVDDDLEIGQLMEMALTQAGCQVTVSRNGKHAIQLLQEKRGKFDLAFLDLMLPGASGVEVIKALRQTKSSTEIVVVTAYPNSDMLFEGMSTGPLTVIGKPFRTENIVEMAERLKAA